MPTTKEMFADVESDAGARADLLEKLQKALADSIARHDSGIDGFEKRVGIIKGAGPGKRDDADRLARRGMALPGLDR